MTNFGVSLALQLLQVTCFFLLFLEKVLNLIRTTNYPHREHHGDQQLDTVYVEATVILETAWIQAEQHKP